MNEDEGIGVCVCVFSFLFGEGGRFRLKSKYLVTESPERL